MTTPTHGLVGYTIVAAPLSMLSIFGDTQLAVVALGVLSALASMFQDAYGEVKRWKVESTSTGEATKISLTRSKSWEWYVSAHQGEVYKFLVRGLIFQAWIHVKMDSLVHDRAPFNKQTQSVLYWGWWVLLELITITICITILKVAL